MTWQAPGAAVGGSERSPVIPLEAQGGYGPAGAASGAAGDAAAEAGGGPTSSYQSAPLAPVSPAAPPSPGDPLAEAPDVIWYVRPPTGGQFGPATADVMRNWIDEGRVSPDSLVWREGWRDWQEAGGVFPQLGAGDEPAFGLGGFLAQPAATPTAGTYPPPRRHRSKAVNAAIITVLVLAVIVLFCVFLWVAFGGRTEQTEKSTTRGNSTVSLARQHATTWPGQQAARNHAYRLLA